MQDIDLSKIENVHFVGIGGIGISAIARMMLGEGKKVTGQDMQESDIVQVLRDLGASITIGQSFENIPQNTDLVIYTIAIEYYDKELFDKLKNQSIPIKSYPEMLGLVSQGKYTIAVAGTHGKTTTTGMIAQILCDVGKDPTVVVGSLIKINNVKQMKENLSRVGAPGERVKRANFALSAEHFDENSNFISGNSDLFVVEACEYRRSFLNINPNILVITNVDEDHLDYYKDIDDIKSAFRELALKVPKDGFVICNPTDQHIIDVVAGIDATIIDYHLFLNEDLKLQIPGMYNKRNAACAKAVAMNLGIDEAQTDEALVNFVGAWRRFEHKGDLLSGTKVYDDYAHHPTEITSSLQGFRELYSREDGWNIVVVFQPHLFSRTKYLIDDFAKSFSDADLVLLLPIYYAREVDDGSVSSGILADKIREQGTEAKAYVDFQTATDYIKKMNLNEKNILITMGAGEAYIVGDNLFNK